MLEKCSDKRTVHRRKEFQTSLFENADRCIPLEDYELAHSFFYPASGRDLNPLVRFSHLVKDFVYADYCGEQYFLFTEGHEPLPGLKVLQVGPQIQIPVDLECLHSLPMSVRRHHRTKEPLWYKVVLLRRIVGNEERLLRLFCINAEAHYAYASIFAKHHVVPICLCTVCDGTDSMGGGFVKLGEPDSSFMELVRQGPLPKYWVQEFDPSKPQPEIKPLGWEACVQGYCGWMSPTSGANYIKLCRVTNGEADTIPKQIFFEQNTRKLLIQETRKITDHLAGFDAIFMPSRLKKMLRNVEQKTAIWLGNVNIKDESGQDRHPVWKLIPCKRRGNTLDESYSESTTTFSSLYGFLVLVSEICATQGYNRIALVPLGIEDEGRALLHWLNEGIHVPQYVKVFIKNRLDLIDIRLPKV